MNQPDGFIDPHGGFRNLKSYQMSEIVHPMLSDCRDCRRYKEDVFFAIGTYAGGHLTP